MKEVKRTFSLHVERRKANTSAKTTEQQVHEESTLIGEAIQHYE